MISKETVAEITKLIADEYQSEQIILFGSYALGNPTPDRDLDLLVISDKEKELPIRKRGLAILYKLRKYHFSKDILFYTKDEIDRWKDVKSAFITEAVQGGVILYGK
jgi:predicted nucleotidyltransferase